MDPIVIKAHSFSGLGTNIGTLSMLAHTNQKFEIHTTPDWYNYLKSFKELYNMENLTVYVDGNVTDNESSYFYIQNDTDKFFAPYFTTDTLHYNNKTYQVNPYKSTRKYIGIACYGDLSPESVFDKEYQAYNKLPYPKCKQYAIEDYAAIFMLAKRTGYDVITMDNPGMPIKEKIFLMNEYCDCVIGYEGGLAHLAHTLKVPYIMLPWHRFFAGRIPEPDEINHKGEEKYPFEDARLSYGYAVHLDEKTYFAKNTNEVLNWSPNKLREIIDMLKQDHGNNIYTSNSKFYLNKTLTKYKLDYMGNESHWWPIEKVSTPHSLDFGVKHYSTLSVAGKFGINYIEE